MARPSGSREGRAAGHTMRVGRPRTLVPKFFSRPLRVRRKTGEGMDEKPVVLPVRGRGERIEPLHRKTATDPDSEPIRRAPIVVGGVKRSLASLTVKPGLATVLSTPVQAGSMLGEPTLAQAGRFVLFAGNWYFARSTNGGTTWAFVDPTADMPDFCCDQDLIYDRGRDLMIWYRQGDPDATGENRFILATSTNGGDSWCTYGFRPSEFGREFAGRSFDYPVLALSNNFLYVKTGVKGKGANSILIRMPLDELMRCSGFAYTWWLQVGYFGGPVQGATTTMYFGDHRGSGNSLRIYSIPENSNSISWVDRGIPSWKLEQGGTCPAADGQNWCPRSDSIVRGGWIGNGKLGFMWNAEPGGSFPFPYIEAAVFNQHDLSYAGRPAIWSPTGAWHYPFVSPNARGDLGAVAFFSSPNSFPSPCILIADDLTPAASHWEARLLRAATAGASAVGDYLRVRPFQPSQLGWAASVYSPQQRGNNVEALAEYFVVARHRDVPTISRYLQA